MSRLTYPADDELDGALYGPLDELRLEGERHQAQIDELTEQVDRLRELLDRLEQRLREER